jgi:hypothetical protein
MRSPLVVGVVMLAISACAASQEFPAPPLHPRVVSPVTLSQSGRVITVRAAKPCGHRPLVIAHSYPHRVSLRIVNRHTSDCHVEGVGIISVCVRLPAPLGTRRLVDATTGKRIDYHVANPTDRRLMPCG